MLVGLVEPYVNHTKVTFEDMYSILGQQVLAVKVTL